MEQIIPVAPSIRVYQPKRISNDYVGDFGKLSTGYRQVTRLYGGWWSAKWDMTDYPDSVKRGFFSRRIGSHVGVFDRGMLVWVGLIWEMEYYDRGVLRRVSMEKVRNAVKCIWTDQSDGTRNETAYFINAQSIDRYGRIEEIVYLDNTYQATAEKYAQTILREQQFPIPRISTVREPKEDTFSQLRVACVGYVHTLNYKFVSISDAERTIGGSLGSIGVTINTDAEFVIQGHIDTNAVLSRPPETATRVWDWISELAEIGDGTSTYTVQVFGYRRLKYYAVGTTPTLFWDGKSLRTSAKRNAVTQKYSVKPGILRDLTWPSAPLEATQLLENKQDSYVSEIEAGMDYEIPILKSDDYNDSDLIANLLQSQLELLEERDTD